MTHDYSLTPRVAGRRVAAVAGIAALAIAVYVAWTQSIPELHVYDGIWMLLWGTVASAAVVPLVWRWKREHSLAAVALASFAGCWVPLVVSAFRHAIPVMARIKGSWVLAGAGIVGVAAPLGFTLLWLALREHTSGESA